MKNKIPSTEPTSSDLIDARIAALGDWCAIDLHEGDEIDATAFTALIRAAVDFNTTKSAARGALSPSPRRARKAD